MTKYWRNDLYALYSGVAVGACIIVRVVLYCMKAFSHLLSNDKSGYFILSIMYGTIVYFSDWKKYADLAVARAEMKIKRHEID